MLSQQQALRQSFALCLPVQGTGEKLVPGIHLKMQPGCANVAIQAGGETVGGL